MREKDLPRNPGILVSIERSRIWVADGGDIRERRTTVNVRRS